MTDSEITVHSRARQCGLCEQLASSGVDLESNLAYRYFDNFVCATCHQKLKALAQLRKLAAQIKAEVDHV
jgi:hypothetical protein